MGTYIYSKVVQGTHPSRSKALEDFIFNRFCMSHPYTGLAIILPNFTFGGFSICGCGRT